METQSFYQYNRDQIRSMSLYQWSSDSDFQQFDKKLSIPPYENHMAIPKILFCLSYIFITFLSSCSRTRIKKQPEMAAQTGDDLNVVFCRLSIKQNAKWRPFGSIWRLFVYLRRRRLRKKAGISRESCSSSCIELSCDLSSS